MAWDFETEPEFQKELDWIEKFVREEVEPLDHVLGNPYDVRDDPRYADVSADEMPLAECLKDVVERMLPYWSDAIVPDLASGRTVLVGAHGNSLRALVKHLDGISDDDISELNLPTGVPIVYEIGDDAMPTETKPVVDRFIGDVEAAKAAAEAVAKQAG